MKLRLSYIVASVAWASLAFSVKPQNTYGAKEITPSTSSSSSSLTKPSSFSKKRSPVSPFFFQEALSRCFSASSPRTPEPTSFSPSISPGGCSGGTVFIFEMPKIPEVSLVRQTLPNPEKASKMQVHSDLNHMEIESKD